MVVGATLRRGRSGTSWRRLVDRVRRRRSEDTALPQAPVSASCRSMSSMVSLIDWVGSPRSWAWTRAAWRSARITVSSDCSSVGSCASTTGSSSRCHACLHCCIRSSLARSAHGGHLLIEVAPHGTSTIVLWPVSGSIRRSGTGLTHTPCATAIVSTIDAVSAGRIRLIAESVGPASVGRSTSGCASILRC
jgi:hypothetical protein